MNMSEYEEFLPFCYHRTVLCHYRASPDLYYLDEDDMGGELKTLGNAGAEPSARPWFQIRFGFRRLTNKLVCVVPFGPDIKSLPEQEQLVWQGHQILNPRFLEGDSAFERWVDRYIGGSWNVQDGPKHRVERLVRLIRALTRQTLGVPLFRFQENPLINYPAAENTDAYANAHLELYRLLVDGLDKNALASLAGHLNITLSDAGRTMNSLRMILRTPHLICTIYKPLKECYDKRQKKHGIPDSPARSFSAFDTFHQDLMEIEGSLARLNDWLQTRLSADSEACLKREGVMSGLFPVFSGPPRPEYKLGDLQKAEGKTIERVEFGELERHPDVHQSEAIVLHFTDGSAIAIRVGSNARNLATDFEGLEPQDVSTDLMVFWAPSPLGKTNS